jgi:hypothetical protein
MAAGDAVVLWDGRDSSRDPLPSGWYTLRLVAHSRTEPIPQATVKVLLDRGLVRTAHAFPQTFSPNGDGFDDVLEIGYLLEGDATVDIRVLRPNGKPLHGLVAKAERKRGWRELTWDGKGDDGTRLPDGKYLFEIRPVYPTGQVSIVVRRPFMLDSRPPEVGEMKPANGSTLRTGTPTISARVLSSLDDLDPSQLKIKIDEFTVNATAFDRQTGVFSFQPKTSLGEGVHIAIAYAQDWAGNYAPPQAVSFKITLGDGKKRFFDRTKPEVLELTPAKGETVYTPTPLITARVRDVDSGIDEKNVLLHINGERVSNAVKLFLPGKSGKPWDWYSYEKAIVLYDRLRGEIRYVPIEPLKPGKNHLTLEVMDRAGNRSAKAETIFSVVLDREPPRVADLRPGHRSTLARPEVTVTATLADVGKSGLAMDTLRLLVDGAPVPLSGTQLAFDAKTGRLAVRLSEPLTRHAQHSVLLTVRDRAGNISAPTRSTFSIVEDGEPPRVDVLSPAAVVPRGRPVLFAAAVFDLGRSGLEASGVTVRLDGRTIPPDKLGTAAVEGWSLSGGLLRNRFETLPPGRHVLTVSVKDRAGNAAPDVAWAFDVK